MWLCKINNKTYTLPLIVLVPPQISLTRKTISERLSTIKLLDEDRKIGFTNIDAPLPMGYERASLRDFDPLLWYKVTLVGCSKVVINDTDMPINIHSFIAREYHRDIAGILRDFANLDRIYIESLEPEVKVALEINGYVVDNPKWIATIAVDIAILRSIVTYVICADRLIDAIPTFAKLASEKRRIVLFECWSTSCEDVVKYAAKAHNIDLTYIERLLS